MAITKESLNKLTVNKLKELCREKGIVGYSKYTRKADLADFIRKELKKSKSRKSKSKSRKSKSKRRKSKSKSRKSKSKSRKSKSKSRKSKSKSRKSKSKSRKSKSKSRKSGCHLPDGCDTKKTKVDILLNKLEN